MIISPIVILPNNMNLSKRFLAAYFAKRNTKFGGGESEDGQSANWRTESLILVRDTRIELVSTAWEAVILPLN